MPLDPLNLLKLTQLADSAFPIGAAAHSLGLETLVAEGLLSVRQLGVFLRDYLAEIGSQEGLFCRAAYRLYVAPQSDFERAWLELNRRVSALKLAREPRKASAMLGKRFLQTVCALCALEDAPRLQRARDLALASSVDIHHATAFGLVGAHIDVDEDLAVATYLQQTTLSLVSASQRLLPLGQAQAMQLLWDLKPCLLEAANKSADGSLDGPAAYCFPGLVEMAGMRHPTLPMRLFIS